MGYIIARDFNVVKNSAEKRGLVFGPNPSREKME
jgi:hypothetical protein